jgi:FkbM family methyltransferase
MGYPFVCHTGESLGANPFYNRDAFRTELELCAAWLHGQDHPTVFDVGANVGFWSTHLAQMLAEQRPEIFAFEPVPTTFAKLVESIERLHLSDRIHVVGSAVVEDAGIVTLSYIPFNSMLARVGVEQSHQSPGTRLAYAAGVRLDDFSSSIGVIPSLVKIDIEGSELRALRGAQRLLKLPNRPGILFEFNPQTLVAAGQDSGSFAELLSGYVLHYVDDFEGQRRPFADRVHSTAELHWVCNLFAVPSHASGLTHWQSAVARASRRLAWGPRRLKHP